MFWKVVHIKVQSEMIKINTAELEISVFFNSMQPTLPTMQSSHWVTGIIDEIDEWNYNSDK